MRKNKELKITPTEKFRIKGELLDAVLAAAKDMRGAADFRIQRENIVAVLAGAAAMSAETREYLEAEAARYKQREEDFLEVLKCFQEATEGNGKASPQSTE